MVKSGGFITGVASILKLPEPTITGAFRVLRESGLMTSGARGVNAPDMTDLDTARMLIALLVSERPAFAESGALDFGGLVCTHFTPARADMVPEECREAFEQSTKNFVFDAHKLPNRHTFEQAVAELIRMYGEDSDKSYWKLSRIDLDERGQFDPHSTIKVIADDLSAEIIMQGNVYSYSDSLVDPNSWGNGETPEEIAADCDAEDAHELKRSRYSTAIRSVRSVNTLQIAALARMLREAGV